MALYQLLVRTLGVEESLFAIVTLLIDRHPEDQSVRSFVKALVSQHDVTVQLQVSDHARATYKAVVTDMAADRKEMRRTMLRCSTTKTHLIRQST